MQWEGGFYFSTMIQPWTRTQQRMSPFSIHAGLDLTAAPRTEFRPRPIATFTFAGDVKYSGLYIVVK